MAETQTSQPAAEEPAIDPSDPMQRLAQTFPHLSREMAARVARYGTEESVPAGTILFARGDRNVDFFLVMDGAIEIFDLDQDGQPHVFTAHRARQFSGELDLFNNRAILVSGRAGADSRIVRVKRPDFHRLVASEPDIGEIITRAFILRRVSLIRHVHGGALLIGPGHAGDTLTLQRFLVRNGFPHRIVDSETDPDAARLLGRFALAKADLPAVVTPGEQVLRNPSTAVLADRLGLTEAIDPAFVYDVAVVGAGPAGLAAAVYAASEGLKTIVVEGMAPGGQAGTSSKIENYLGFPTGISGEALAGRAQVQAQKFGARLAISRMAVRLHCETTLYRIELEGGGSIAARSIVVATGARYRKLDVANFAKYEGQGIHYAATAMEGHLCIGEEVAVVGGGNSAGQAAVFLSRIAGHVHVVVRAPGLAATMSDYLVQRIHSSPRITLHPYTEITALDGDDRLRQVAWTDRRAGATDVRDMGNLFVMIGAAPNTDWLDGCLDLDDKGFVLTGQERGLSPYATAVPGIFAVGDVRSGSVKRVASGVGEGSVVIQAIHQYLHDLAA